MENKKKIYSWILYDWANSAFATVILAAVLPIFYKDVAAKGLPNNLATSYWGYTQAVAMLIIAFLAPILGAMADYSGSQKSFFKSFVFLGVTGTALLFFIIPAQDEDLPGIVRFNTFKTIYQLKKKKT